MTPEVFDELLGKVKHRLLKYSIRKPINPECRLFMTLMYLAHAMDHFTLSRLFRVGRSTAQRITQEVTKIIWSELASEFLPVPDENTWKANASEFYRQWQFPNCCGALDGKHVVIQCPPQAGSLYYNYKKQHSIVLLAVCDANYNFVAVDIGAYGGNSDGSVFSTSEFGRRLRNENLNLPPPTCLPNSDQVSPHFIVGDAAFPLLPSLMRPYPGRNLPTIKDYFNQRLSRARRTIENAFGIMVARWRILKAPLIMTPQAAENITKAIVVLHNFSNKRARREYAPPGFPDYLDNNGQFVDGEWRRIADPLPSVAAADISRNHNAPRNAYQVRDNLAQYVTENPLPFAVSQ
nr:protein ALP1-like [Aedes albopictus]